MQPRCCDGKKNRACLCGFSCRAGITPGSERMGEAGLPFHAIPSPLALQPAGERSKIPRFPIPATRSSGTRFSFFARWCVLCLRRIHEPKHCGCLTSLSSAEAASNTSSHFTSGRFDNSSNHTYVQKHHRVRQRLRKRFFLDPLFVGRQARLTQLADWVGSPQEPPAVTWLSGLFNPQSFLTAIMQARVRQAHDETHCQREKTPREALVPELLLSRNWRVICPGPFFAAAFLLVSKRSRWLTPRASSAG